MDRKTQVGFLVLLDFQFLHFVEQSATRFVKEFPWASMVEQALPGAIVPLFIVLNVGLIAIGLACYVLWVRPSHPAARTVVLVWIGIESAIAIATFIWAASVGEYVSGLVTAFLLLGACVWLATRLPRSGPADPPVMGPIGE
ncbi:MAG: hypothetical protein WD040_04240 [Anaerolineales bacterium]